jgi:acetylornithine deacetylase
MKDETKAILARLVAFDTTSRNSNLDLIGWVEDYLGGLGVASTRIYGDDPAKANLWATIGPADRPGYVLSGHTDVVPVDDQDWSTDPFVLTERDGRLYGRGTADMKGFLACCLAEVPAMLAAPLSAPIHLVFSHDEEIGCIGVRPMLHRIDELTPVKPRAAFVGEPTNLQVVIGHKGKYNYRVTIHGRPCHSSRAPDGVNAVDVGAEIVMAVRDIARRLAAPEAPRDMLYDVPFSTAHTGIIQGGTILNIVPEHCVVEFEFRMIASEDHAPYEAEMRALVARLDADMKARAPETGIVMELTSGTPGFDTPPDAEPARLARRFAARNDQAKVAYGTEAGLFADLGGVPSVVCGPGSIEQAHRPDEFVAIAELDKCERFLANLVAHCRQG